MEHRFSLWQTIMYGRRACRCGEAHPCVRRVASMRTKDLAPRPGPALNPDMDPS